VLTWGEREALWGGGPHSAGGRPTSRNAFGIGPQEYLVKTRVLAAIRLLRGTDRGLAEIVLDCGFCDQSAFTSHFRRCVGMTPSRFRRGILVAARGAR
jgi:AraC-like DNA-binding protein